MKLTQTSYENKSDSIEEMGSLSPEQNNKKTCLEDKLTSFAQTDAQGKLQPDSYTSIEDKIE